MVRTRVALALLVGLLMAPAASAATPTPRLNGESYDQARAKIIKLGFQPVRFVRTEDACLIDKACKRYPELIDCSLNGAARCQFAFVDRTHQKYLLVTTRGQPRRVDKIKIPSRRERMGWPLIQHQGAR
jgi:hypothetical protein